MVKRDYKVEDSCIIKYGSKDQQGNVWLKTCTNFEIVPAAKIGHTLIALSYQC